MRSYKPIRSHREGRSGTKPCVPARPRRHSTATEGVESDCDVIEQAAELARMRSGALGCVPMACGVSLVRDSWCARDREGVDSDDKGGEGLWEVVIDGAAGGVGRSLVRRQADEIERMRLCGVMGGRWRAYAADDESGNGEHEDGAHSSFTKPAGRQRRSGRQPGGIEKPRLRAVATGGRCEAAMGDAGKEGDAGERCGVGERVTTARGRAGDVVEPVGAASLVFAVLVCTRRRSQQRRAAGSKMSDGAQSRGARFLRLPETVRGARRMLGLVAVCRTGRLFEFGGRRQRRRWGQKKAAAFDVGDGAGGGFGRWVVRR
ncbi:hypothetical protein D9619_004304 [Psilocybe cf. subviscida]|uniref:Uncharacterized protein n=1 Tax=Psilocybe cf. subviscida TaxID=2480587 RepID=A0A8H5F925_9AGAR|nr:hypothetical protein D9619_004304 [Psilocybe cf. subviscida]